MAAKKGVRRRRTAEEARTEILDAAERRLRDGGPDAIRLQEIAADVGISHPAVLHHFGSREGLVEAVIDRTMTKLEGELLSVFMRGSESGEPPDPVELHERVAEVLARGQARLIAWLALSGHVVGHSKEAREGWKLIIDATHAMRLGRVKGKAKAKATYEDTAFTVTLSSMVMFADALIGEGSLEAGGLPTDERSRRRFRAWFSKLLERHLEDP